LGGKGGAKVIHQESGVPPENSREASIRKKVFFISTAHFEIGRGKGENRNGGKWWG